MNFTRSTHSEPETRAFAAEVANRLRPGDIVALDGELGAGKTSFVRGLAEGLGIPARDISSPTFIIQRRHEGTNVALVHIDAYRLGGPDELESIGWHELLDEEDVVIAVEWAERISEAIPGHRAIRIRINHVDESSRRLTIECDETAAERFRSLRPRSKPCPTCEKPVTTDARWFPFCSERCRLIDLGEWMEEKYRVTRPIDSTDLE